MALAVNPQLLILDEPTTGLDATVEAEILDLIEELRGRINAAILLITHNLGPGRPPLRARRRALRRPPRRGGPGASRSSPTRGTPTPWACCAACRASA